MPPMNRVYGQRANNQDHGGDTLLWANPGNHATQDIAMFCIDLPERWDDVGGVKSEIPKVLTAAQKRLIRSEYGHIPERYRITRPLGFKDSPQAKRNIELAKKFLGIAQ